MESGTDAKVKDAVKCIMLVLGLDILKVFSFKYYVGSLTLTVKTGKDKPVCTSDSTYC